MARKKQSELYDRVRTVSILKNAKHEWPQGYGNETIRAWQKQKEEDLKDEIHKILDHTEKGKGNNRPGTPEDNDAHRQ